MKNEIPYIFLTATMTLLFSGCASMAPTPTAPPVPSIRKFDAQSIDKVDLEKIVIQSNNSGLSVSWTSAAIAQGQNGYTYYTPPGTSPLAGSIGGAIGESIGLAMVDNIPYERAKSAANITNTSVDTETLDTSLKTAINQTLRNQTNISPDISLVDEAAPEDKLLIETLYTLSEDADVLKVTVQVTYNSSEFDYVSPHSFGGFPKPEHELAGPIYRNRFTYYSAPVALPTLTEALRSDLIKNLKAQREVEIEHAKRTITKAGAQERRISLIKQRFRSSLRKAEDDKISGSEAAAIRAGEWIRDDGKILREEIANAHDFVARMLTADLADFETPSYMGNSSSSFQMVGTDNVRLKVIDTLDDSRVFGKVGSGYYSGSYVSFIPDSFGTYGNAILVADQYNDKD